MDMPNAAELNVDLAQKLDRAEILIALYEAMQEGKTSIQDAIDVVKGLR